MGILIEAGADPDLNKEYGADTPLHIAVEDCEAEIVEKLLVAGADPNHKRHHFWDDGEAPLHIAVDRGDMEILRMLFNAGANPNQGKHPFWGDGDTPLDMAVKDGKAEIVRILAGTSTGSKSVPSQDEPTPRSLFEASEPSGYTKATLRDTGTVWGVPCKYTSDSSQGAVTYMLLGMLKGCSFANLEADRQSKVYIRVEQLGRLSGFESEKVCRMASRTWDSWNGLRITHLRFFDEGSSTKTREFVYDSATGQYVE